ncbi:hypothetical protein ACP70R_007415 [Stipagrostis hirtigluma subsp. patula]
MAQLFCSHSPRHAAGEHTDTHTASTQRRRARHCRRAELMANSVRFAAVCPQWRAAARQGRLPPPLPLLALPDGTVYSLPGSKPLRFPACAGYADACGNWLFFLNEDGCFLRDPFSNATVTLPALSRYRVRHLGGEPVDEADMARMEIEEGKQLSVSKLMFCSPHIIAAIVILGRSTRIAVCQPGATSWWSVSVDRWSPRFVDLAFHQGKLYVLTFQDILCAVNISVDHNTNNPWVSQIRELFRLSILLRGFRTLTMTYLVESRGKLLAICRKIHRLFTEKRFPVAFEQNEFAVFEADFGQSRWIKVTTIGKDQVLFLRRGCCRSVCILHNEMPGDRIFYMDNVEEDRCWFGKFSSSSCSVYDMRDGKVSNPLPMVSWKCGPVYATWLFPQD